MHHPQDKHCPPNSRGSRHQGRVNAQSGQNPGHADPDRAGSPKSIRRTLETPGDANTMRSGSEALSANEPRPAVANESPADRGDEGDRQEEEAWPNRSANPEAGSPLSIRAAVSPPFLACNPATELGDDRSWDHCVLKEG